MATSRKKKEGDEPVDTAATPRPRRPRGVMPLLTPGLGEFPGMPLLGVARQFREWADSMMAMAGPATDLAVAAAGARARDPEQKAAITKAGATLRRMRESAGLTVQEVAKALDLSDPELLETAEGGRAALPFELILRLAAVLGRDDPVTSLMQLTRVYNPPLWMSLEQLGVGKLMVQAGRERELANVYRGNDAARRLDDEDFAAVLAFTKQAFDMAVAFRGKSED
ncbi:MAG: helix-turn-helix transcriptional regulator [Burkholderiaceae bacterium]